MENKIQTLKNTPSTALLEALKNSDLILVHAAESGLELKKEDIRILTESKQALAHEEWTIEIEIEFWMVYKNLSKLIHPVTIDSLKAAQETEIKQPSFIQKLLKKKRRRTIAHRSVRFHTGLALVTMLSMLVIYIYFFIGTTRLNHIQKCDNNIEKIQKRLDEIMIITGMDFKNPSAELEKERLFSKLAETDNEKKSNIELLEGWLNTFKLFIFLKSKEEYESEQENINNEFAPPMSAPDQMQDDKIKIIQEAENYVLVLGLYILPLFFGLLGAIAFDLRDLVHQTKKMEFSKESNINYTLRLILGTIAGLAVGLLWGDLTKQDSINVISTLGPLVIAFVAGLSVEYVFAGLEKLVANFINKSVNNKSK